MSAMVITLLSVLSIVSCQKEKTSALEIYYSGVTNMGQSMNFTTGAPSYRGSAPSDFLITGVKLGDENVADFSTNFSIDAATGAITVANTTDLPVGIYKITVSCMADGSSFTFPDVITVEMLPPFPATIEVTPPLVTVPFKDPAGNVADSAVVTVTSSTCSVLSYSLVQDDAKKYFSITKQGVIRRNKDFAGDIPPGMYKLTIVAKTAAGQTSFADAVTFNIVSPPLSLSYIPSSSKMEFNYAYATTAPSFVGSLDQLVFSIKSVTPSTDKITINPSTGVVSVAANSQLPVGSNYTVSVRATNGFGTKDFDNILTLTVIAFINPISGFSYASATQITGVAWSASPAAGMVGDEVTYTFSNLPAALAGKVTLDPATGTVSAAKGNKIAVGSYSVGVTASNSKGSVTATLALSVVPNPNAFTKIIYGNNLGLSPAENYANQFRFASAAAATVYFTSPLLPTTDIPAGKTAVWSMRRNAWLPAAASTASIDPATGGLTVPYFSAGNSTFFVVTATVGQGTPEEFSVSVPVFFSYIKTVPTATDPNYGKSMIFTPFVVKVNPLTGGTSAPPQLLNGSLTDKLAVTYRRSFRFIDLKNYDYTLTSTNLPSPQVTETTVSPNIALDLWTAYYKAVGKTLNTGAYDPVAYAANSANPGVALCYASSTDGSVVINPGRFVDGSGQPLNGIFAGQLPYSTDGNVATATAAGADYQIFPLLLWFDENF